MKICVVGLGLIGGSMSLGLRQKAECILGVEANQENAAEALKLGLADKIVDLAEGVTNADLVILAIPVNQAREILGRIGQCRSPQKRTFRGFSPDGGYRILRSFGGLSRAF